MPIIGIHLTLSVLGAIIITKTYKHLFFMLAYCDATDRLAAGSILENDFVSSYFEETQ